MGREGAASLSRRLQNLTVIATVLAAGLVYFWLATAGHFGKWPWFGGRVAMQASGFRAGHLHIPYEPSPELLAQPDPYDPRHLKIWAWDTTLYQGRYYQYWGPAPSVLLLAASPVVDIQHVGDGKIVLAAAFARLALAAWLIVMVWRRAFPGAPLWTVCLGIGVVAFAVPLPNLLTRGAVYEVAILTAQAFLAAALVCGFAAIGPNASSRRRTLLLLACGLCLGGALASRASQLFAIGGVALATAWAAMPAGRRFDWRPFAAVFAPIAGAGALLALYNYARFGSVLDFGVAYMLTTHPYASGLRYVLYNVYMYLFRAVNFTPEFPFIEAPWIGGVEPAPPPLATPDYYFPGEPLPGMVYVFPWFVFVFAAASLARALLRRASPPSRDRVWLLACGVSLAVLSFLPVIHMFASIMRYLGDVTLGLSLLSMLGLWWLHERHAAGRWKALSLASVACVACAYTVATGMLLGIHSQNRLFQVQNPELYEWLRQVLTP